LGRGISQSPLTKVSASPLDSLETNKYSLQDCGQGSGTFLKMMRDHFVADGELYSIGKDLNFLVEVTGIPQTLSIKLVESVTS
jgi:hypothetical protein